MEGMYEELVPIIADLHNVTVDRVKKLFIYTVGEIPIDMPREMHERPSEMIPLGLYTMTDFEIVLEPQCSSDSATKLDNFMRNSPNVYNGALARAVVDALTRVSCKMSEAGTWGWSCLKPKPHEFRWP